MKNILITGGCGFIGSNFLNYCVNKYPQYNFINIDAMYYCASHDNIEETVRNSNNYKFIEGKIQDISLIKYILKTENITNIIHFAAQSHVDNSFENSLQYTDDNVKGTHVLLECVRQVNKDIVFLHFSTDEVYGESNLDEDPKNEMSVLCPTNPYAASKAAAEMYVNSYIHSYGLKCIITRGNNVYGPNQYPEKLIPKFIKLLKNGDKLTIHGDGSSLRSFIHVLDVCSAVDTILHNGIIGQIYNIGSEPEYEKSVLDVAKILVKKIKNDDDYEKYLEFVQDRPFNDKRYFITNEKLKELEWNINIDFITGISDLIFTDYKINLNELFKTNLYKNKLDYFGSWINDIDTLKNHFSNNEPFSYMKIDNFLSLEYAELIYKNYPTDFDNWHKYNNPIEVKYANDNIKNMNKHIKKLFYLLSSQDIINVFSKISSIKDLEYDPYLNGAGLHSHGRYGRLHLHLDYEKHPKLNNKQRRLNIILFLTKDWKKEWNGDNQLWDNDAKKCMVKTYPKFNTAIIFRTNDYSWHGLPEKIMCPENVFRKTLAYYYISPFEYSNKESLEYRTKAKFTKKPSDIDYPQMKKLYEIRPKRRIEKEDLDEIWPEWTPELF